MRVAIIVATSSFEPETVGRDSHPFSHRDHRPTRMRPKQAPGGPSVRGSFFSPRELLLRVGQAEGETRTVEEGGPLWWTMRC